MVANLLVFLILVLLVVFFGWLTWRAVRARRVWVKIAGGIAAGLLTVLFAAITVFAAKGMLAFYVSPAPVPDLSVAGTPEQIARGEYLVNIACVGCHGADGKGEMPLSGGLDIAGDIPVPIGSLVAANITPGGVLAERSDGELFRVLRHGYGKGQRASMMSYLPYRQLSDEDTMAIIAYLRSLPPVQTASNGGDKVNMLGLLLFYGAGLQPMPPTTTGAITAPPPGVNPEYGKYVATFGECRGCHGEDLTGTPATAVNPAIVNPRPFTQAITQEQFIQMMRTGKRPGGAELMMPWQNAAKMTDDDLAALYAYLTAQP